MKKRDILEKRIGENQEITARTLDRALMWLVKQGDIGERQLMVQRGQPKVYWLAYKPPGGPGESNSVYSRQTPFTDNPGGENKPSAALVEGRMADSEECIHDFPGGENCYLCDPNHPYRKEGGTG